MSLETFATKLLLAGYHGHVADLGKQQQQKDAHINLKTT